MKRDVTIEDLRAVEDGIDDIGESIEAYDRQIEKLEDRRKEMEEYFVQLIEQFNKQHGYKCDCVAIGIRCVHEKLEGQGEALAEANG